MTTTYKSRPEIVSPAAWQSALDQHLLKEKELTRARDALNAERRKLPMVKVAKHYSLKGENGQAKTAFVCLWIMLNILRFVDHPDRFWVTSLETLQQGLNLFLFRNRHYF